MPISRVFPSRGLHGVLLIGSGSGYYYDRRALHIDRPGRCIPRRTLPVLDHHHNPRSRPLFDFQGGRDRSGLFDVTPAIRQCIVLYFYIILCMYVRAVLYG